MSIEIKITDPSKVPACELRALITLLHTFTSINLETSSIQPMHSHTHGIVGDTTGAPIAPEDSPAAGVDASEIFAGGGNPAEVFAGGANPAEVFAGNAPAAPLPIASNPVNVSAPAQNTNLAPVQNGATVELDKRGLPWDARIHAETKSQIKAGTWKNKRGVDDATIAAVEAELRAVLAVGSPNSPPAVPVPPAPPGVTTVTAPISAAPSVPTPPAVGTLAPPPPVASGAIASTPAAPSVAITFPQLCARITGGLGNGSLSQDTLAAVLGKYQLQGLPTLASFPNLVGPVAADLGFV